MQFHSNNFQTILANQFAAFAWGLLDTEVVPIPVCYPDVEIIGTEKLHINARVCKGIVRWWKSIT